MLERLILAGTVTCLLYLFLQFGHSSMTPTQGDQTASYIISEHSPTLKTDRPSADLTVAQK